MTAGYGSKTALHQVCLRFPNTRVTALLGPGGSGKSTTLRILEGQTSDDLWWQGERRVDCSTTVFQTQLPRNPFEVKQVRQELADRSWSGTVEEVWGTIPEAAEAVTRILDSRPEDWSLWHLQLLRLTVTAHASADLYLIDEPEVEMPFSALPWLTLQLRRLARRALVVMVTHNLCFARQAAHEVILLADGHVLQYGETESLFEHPSSPRIEQFLQLGG
ncbi:MAG: ATP-binding cassette domain-containing protein [Acidobacteriota bacterium]|nr:ATP-binding cassette domain-containing protein [Acidobacteriota bacterium]